MTRRGLLLDVDGTLVDSNWQHAIAWSRALVEHGHRGITTAAAHRAIGMASDRLLTHLTGANDDAVADRHGELMAEMTDHIVALPGAPELLTACRDAGYRTVLVTSADEEDLEWMLPLIGGRSAVDLIVTSADIHESKPSPEPYEVAMHKAGLAPAECVVIGDSVWDMRSATAAGVSAVGVTCGGTTAAELVEAGAREMYADPAELLERLRHNGFRLS